MDGGDNEKRGWISPLLRVMIFFPQNAAGVLCKKCFFQAPSFNLQTTASPEVLSVSKDEVGLPTIYYLRFFSPCVQ